jgi:prefoldin alpha subunit
MVEQKEAQRKLLRFQILRGKSDALMKRRDELLLRMLDIESTLNSIKEIEKDSNKNILLPIGSDVHIKGTLEKLDKMIVALGADTAVESTVEKTKEILEKRRKVLEAGLKSLEDELINLNNELMKLQPEIVAMLQGSEKSQSDTSAD